MCASDLQALSGDKPHPLVSWPLLRINHLSAFERLNVINAMLETAKILQCLCDFSFK